MSVFTDQCFLLLRDPHGGVEDLAAMRAAGFTAVFCNIGDFPPAEWEAIVRPRALTAGMDCGPWLRTTDAGGLFSLAKLDFLIGVADRWASPLIVNSEAELKGSGSTLTQLIADRLGGRQAALSMEPWPFDDVSWVPLANIPVLPQMFGALGWHDPIVTRDQWWAYGVKCIFPTFGTYGGSVPSDYPLNAPYSLYTADDCGGNYTAWSPTGTGYQGCKPKPTNGGAPVAGKGVAASAVAAWSYWLSSTAKPDAWRQQNPGEWAKLQEYNTAPAGTPPPVGIETATGRMLLEIVEARRYADGSHA